MAPHIMLSGAQDTKSCPVGRAVPGKNFKPSVLTTDLNVFPGRPLGTTVTTDSSSYAVAAVYTAEPGDKILPSGGGPTQCT